MTEQDRSTLPIKPVVLAPEEPADAGQIDNVRAGEVEPSKSVDLVPSSISALNDALLLKKIGASVDEQLSLLKLSFGALGKLSDQVKQQTEEALARLQRPIFLELVLLNDNLERAIEWARGSSEMSVEDVVSRMEILKIELLEILSRKDVHPFEEHPASLDPKLHRTMKTLPTEESSENNTVAQVLRTGFFWGEKSCVPRK